MNLPNLLYNTLVMNVGNKKLSNFFYDKSC